ncbi:MAG TPA: cache domain-containing protein, partial [Thermoanaerobaculia bacterium]|nr:cache domain-containing protein [Thermoanaerobaculia bacterium]
MAASRGLSIATRIFLGTALVLVLVLGAAIVTISTLGKDRATRAARKRILASSSLLGTAEKQRYEQLHLLAEVLAGNPELKAYLLQSMDLGDSYSILDQLDERRIELGFDLAILTDTEGTVVARVDLPDATGASLADRPMIRKVRSEFDASGIWEEGSRLYDAVATPMALGEGIFGYLVLGYQVSDVRAIDVRNATGSSVLFLAGKGATSVASSMTPPETQEVVGALRRAGDVLARAAEKGESSVQAELDLGRGRSLAQLLPLRDAAGQPVGAVVSLASLDEELAGYQEIRNLLIVAGALSLLAALGIAFLLSRRVSRPIAALVRAVGEARGGNYDVTLPRGGSGEVLSLANAFNELLAELRERRDMAEYVAKLSRNLPDASAGPVPQAS